MVEVLDIGEESDEEEDGAAADVNAQRKGKSCVIRTSTRQTIYLPVPGLVDVSTLTPGDLVGTNKDSYLILEKLPSEFDSRVKVSRSTTIPPNASCVPTPPSASHWRIGSLTRAIPPALLFAGDLCVIPMATYI